MNGWHSAMQYSIVSSTKMRHDVRCVCVYMCICVFAWSESTCSIYSFAHGSHRFVCIRKTDNTCHYRCTPYLTSIVNCSDGSINSFYLLQIRHPSFSMKQQVQAHYCANGLHCKSGVLCTMHFMLQPTNSLFRKP